MTSGPPPLKLRRASEWRAGCRRKAKADPPLRKPQGYPNLPDPLVLKDGNKVTSVKMWWEQRRPAPPPA